jgi:hypothetical protein
MLPPGGSGTLTFDPLAAVLPLTLMLLTVPPVTWTLSCIPVLLTTGTVLAGIEGVVTVAIWRS